MEAVLPPSQMVFFTLAALRGQVVPYKDFDSYKALHPRAASSSLLSDWLAQIIVSSYWLTLRLPFSHWWNTLGGSDSAVAQSTNRLTVCVFPFPIQIFWFLQPAYIVGGRLSE